LYEYSTKLDAEKHGYDGLTRIIPVAEGRGGNPFLSAPSAQFAVYSRSAKKMAPMQKPVQLSVQMLMQIFMQKPVAERRADKYAENAPMQKSMQMQMQRSGRRYAASLTSAITEPFSMRSRVGDDLPTDAPLPVVRLSGKALLHRRTVPRNVCRRASLRRSSRAAQTSPVDLWR